MEKITGIEDRSQLKSALWELAREGARSMIQVALLQEQQEFLEQYGHNLTETGQKQFVKNGFLPERNIMMPAGNIPVNAPRIRDQSNQKSDIQFSSKILPKYLRKTRELDDLIPFLYLKGISTNDFSEVLTAMLGSDVSVSPASVVRLKKVWSDEFEEWNSRSLKNKKYVYWWADGVYFNSRMDGERNCILVIIGATEAGNKEILAIQTGYRESEISWRELLMGLKKRGLSQGPKLATGDGALGFWKALRQEFSETIEQRCWVHKTANILDKFPQSLQASAKNKIHEIYMSDTKENALKSFDDFVSLYEAKYPKAVECLLKNKNETLAFYDFPADHWQHIRSSNPIESTFATVRLRTNKTKGSGTANETVTMVFKMIQSAEKRWRKLRGFKQILLVMEGRKFINGVLDIAA